jgi:hypothetical protein
MPQRDPASIPGTGDFSRQRCTQKITQNFPAALRNESGKDQFYRDTEIRGFGVRVTPKGLISFFAEGRLKRGRTKRFNLGRFPALSVADARTQAYEKLRLYREGVDPHEMEREERERREREKALQESLGVTLQDVIESFFRARRLKEESGYRNVIKNCFGDWLDRPVRSITRQAVEDRYLEIAYEKGTFRQSCNPIPLSGAPGSPNSRPPAVGGV